MDDRPEGQSTERPAPARPPTERLRPRVGLANPRRVRWSTLVHGAAGLAAAGALAGGAVVGGVVTDATQDVAPQSRAVPVLWLTHPDDGTLGDGARSADDGLGLT